MRRAPIVIAGTVAGLAGVLAYHPSSARSLHALTAITASQSSGVSVPSSGGVSTASPSAAKSAAPTSTTAPQQARAATVSQQTQTRSATGEDVSYQYGDLQLKVTMSGTRITDVSVAQLNIADPRSASIDQYAVPQLRQEVLAAQSAQIDGVSGASYTSQAYQQSLQSALDKLAASKAR